MKKTDTVIKLNEIPQEGRSYTYSQDSAELTQVLKDLIGEHNYHLEFHIQPMGNAYEMKGTLKTFMNLQCSRCGIDFQFPVNQEFHELLVIDNPLPRNSQSSKANHISELLQEGPFCNYLETEELNVPEFAHEMVAVAEPMQPTGKANCDDTCENYVEARRQGWIQTPGEIREEFQRDNPFRELEKLKNH